MCLHLSFVSFHFYSHWKSSFRLFFSLLSLARCFSHWIWSENEDSPSRRGVRRLCMRMEMRQRKRKIDGSSSNECELCAGQEQYFCLSSAQLSPHFYAPASLTHCLRVGITYDTYIFIGFLHAELKERLVGKFMRSSFVGIAKKRESQALKTFNNNLGMK